MVADDSIRDVAGIKFHCPKLGGSDGLDLYLRTSVALRAAKGLLVAVAIGPDEATLIHEYFEFAREMDPKVIHSLIMELSRIPQPSDGTAYPSDLELEEIVELAFFAAGVNFGRLLPAGMDPLFVRRHLRRGTTDLPLETGADEGPA